MRISLTVLMLLFLGLSSFGVADSRDPITLKPLDDQIQFYQNAVKKNPDDGVNSNRLAYAYIKKVRATGDQTYNALAEKLLHKTLEIDNRNYDSLVYLALVKMSRHRFAEARNTAGKAIEINSENSEAYGVLGDASFELGLYQECADAYQKMMDLRPSAAAYGRAFYYRRITGDLEGATQMMIKAYQYSDFRDPENVAWCLLQLGNLSFGSGKINEAEQIFQKALNSLPNYYNAIAGLAKVKVAQGKVEEAVALYEKAISIVPMPEFVASLGDLYVSVGRTKEAEKQYQLVEYIGLISKANKEIYNRQLAMFYADHDRNLEEALALAQAEIESRKDVYGYDALAWCLYKNGKYNEALEAMNKALEMGTQDAMLFFHAGMIHDRLNQPVEARRFLEDARKLNAYFHPIFSEIAQETLIRINSEKVAGS
jgi:tetratricopeptide (TPR) repeat protein